MVRGPILALLVVLGGSVLPPAGEEIRVIPNITFGIVTDLKDYGPPRNIMSRDIHAVTVRYFDGSFRDIQEVQRYLTSMMRSEKGSTTTHCPWAESLPVPSVEAVIQFASGEKGRLLLWRQGCLVYQDPAMSWWFAHGW